MAKSLNRMKREIPDNRAYGSTALLQAAREGWQTTLRLALLLLIHRGLPAALGLYLLLSLRPPD
ncbi:hypothetical protein [Mycetocola miduiensis]|uniref:Uncharacterized protein n=1 Tax=Mycetocola miduiensis TaxID=995034 RepID=A0A1I5AJS4_9MICO|nr:hypothetical protein [Mycetocola miduiensis]SFN62632.1 hypothetical protein SAMN05216219_1512 [Mycetocola miduiensis]